MEKNIENLLSEELSRFRSINNYIGSVTEQEELDMDIDLSDEESTDSTEDEEMGSVFDSPSTEDADSASDEMDLDVDMSDTEVEDVDSGEETEELEVTDLIDGQKDLENRFSDVESKVDMASQKIDSVSAKLDSFDEKFEELDGVYAAVTGLEDKIEDMKPKTPEQKLELRSLDSYPFNQKLTDFFDEKGEEMDETGKDEYVLTVDDVENMSKIDIAKSFSSDNG
jgi:hypothetical protein